MCMTPNFPLIGNNKTSLDAKERNKLMKKGLVVEPSTTPMNGSMV